jgi:hypothetical protein
MSYKLFMLIRFGIVTGLQDGGQDSVQMIFYIRIAKANDLVALFIALTYPLAPLSLPLMGEKGEGGIVRAIFVSPSSFSTLS